MYIDKVDPFHTAESRTHIMPGKRKYLVHLSVRENPGVVSAAAGRAAELMDGHIQIGNKYPSVKLNTTYSFGLDDQEFVVAFETDEPKDFLDLVMELRETESSKYTLRDTPIFTLHADADGEDFGAVVLMCCGGMPDWRWGGWVMYISVNDTGIGGIPRRIRAVVPVSLRVRRVFYGGPKRAGGEDQLWPRASAWEQRQRWRAPSPRRFCRMNASDINIRRCG